MPSLGKTTWTLVLFRILTLATVGTSICAFWLAANLDGLLLVIRAALAIRLFEMPELLADEGEAAPNTFDCLTLRKTGFELTTMPSAIALFARF